MDVVERIEALWTARRRRNPRYSLRALARDMQVDHGGLSQVLARRRPVSEGWLRRLAGPLRLDAASLAELTAAEHERKLVAHLRVARSPPSVRDIAVQTGMSMDDVCVAIQRLLSKGVLLMSARTRWELRGAR